MAHPERYAVRKSFTDENGQRHHVRGATAAEVEAKIAVLKRDLAQGIQVVNSSTKVAEWGEKWLKTYKENNISAAWYTDMRAMLNNRVYSEIGGMKLAAVKPIHIQQILNGLSGLSSSYIRKVYNILREMFRDAVNNKLLNVSPVDGVTLPKAKPAEERRALTDRELDLLLEVLPGHRGNLFCKIMLFCGLRPSEVMALRWCDIDIKGRLLSVNKAVKKDGTLGGTKSKAGTRVVPIPDILACELAAAYGEPFALVCTQLNGKQHTKSSVRKLWESVKREMDIMGGAVVFRNAITVSTLTEPLVLYDLRHTYCTNLQRAGVPIDVARRLMGHSDIVLTSKIYTHYSADVIDNAREMINNSIEKKKAPTLARF